MKRESNEGGLIPCAFFALAFENELEYHYLYVCINSSDDQATSDINLLASDKYMYLQQASISDPVSISTFARGQHGYVSLLPASGQHCGADRAIC